VKSNIEEYRKNGYIILKEVFDNSQIDSLKNYIKTLSVKLKVPYSDEAWGYGDCSGLEKFKIITKEPKILSTLSELLNSSFMINHLMINRKAPWIGPEVEYHQEVFNSKTFAPGATYKDLVDNWCQIYIPLESETSSNGGLRIITKSHLLGVLDSEDMINQNYSHKRRVPTKVLSDIESEDGHRLLDLDLQAGDCLLFSPLLVHGSPSNGTPSERISLVMQARSDKFIPDESIFRSETEYRNIFMMESLREKIKEIEKVGENRYSAFKKNNLGE
jgi:ectoine hydroxylase-related dioxygenase (phytanoyl-CoA dioxygenase family)